MIRSDRVVVDPHVQIPHEFPNPTQPTTKQQTEQQRANDTHSSGLYPGAPTTPSSRQRSDIVQCRQISLSFDDRREGGEGQEGGGEDGLDRAEHRDGL